jgi:hypothetical protein
MERPYVWPGPGTPHPPAVIRGRSVIQVLRCAQQRGPDWMDRLEMFLESIARSFRWRALRNPAAPSTPTT